MIHAGIVGQVRIYLQHAHYEFIKSPLNLKGMLYFIVYSEGKSVRIALKKKKIMSIHNDVNMYMFVCCI